MANWINRPLKVYLACPYWHDDESIRLERFNKVTEAAGQLMLKGYIVFSPITHSHPIAQEMDRGEHRPGGKLGHDFWLNQDKHYLEWCDEVWILKLDGYRQSFGIGWECEYVLFGRARPIRDVDPITLEITGNPWAYKGEQP